MGVFRFLDPIFHRLVLSWVILSVLLVVVPTLATTEVVFLLLQSEMRRAADLRLEAGTAYVQTVVDEQTNRLYRSAVVVSQSPHVASLMESGQTEATLEFLAPLLSLAEIEDVLILNSDGLVVRSKGSGLAADAPASPSANTSIRRALMGETTLQTEITTAGDLRQSVYMPMGQVGAQRAPHVLQFVATIRQQDLNAFKARTGLDVSLVRDGQVVSSTFVNGNNIPDKRRSLTLAMPDALDPLLRDVNSESSKNSTQIVAATAPTQTSDGNVGITVTLDDVEGDVGRALASVLPFTVSIALVGSILAWALVSRVRAPMRQLAAAASRLHDGDFTTPIPDVKHIELLPLALALDRARVGVREHLQVMRNEEARQRELIAAIPDPVIVTSLGGHVTAYNPAAGTLLTAREPLIGRPIRTLIPFVADRGLADTSVWRGRIEISHGHPVEMEVRNATFEEGLLPAGNVYILHDVSFHAEMARLREQFLHDIAHELRTPLSVLENALDIVSDQYATLSVEEFRRLIGSATRTTGQLHKLMDDLLSAGNIQAGQFVVSPEPVPISEILSDACNDVAGLLEQREQGLNCNVPDGDLIVLADRRYLRQVISNLLSNASKYSPPGDVVVVDVVRSGRFASITIDDHGAGIPPDQLERIFERYYRLRPAGEEPGVGLGLAIAKGIVDAHGGEIGIKSELGSGTSVSLKVPLAGNLSVRLSDSATSVGGIGRNE